MVTKLHELQKWELIGELLKLEYRNLELKQDAHHFYLGSFAGVLCFVMASLLSLPLT